MDVPRFIGVNTARGPWSLIEDMGTTSAMAPSGASAIMPSNVQLPAPDLPPTMPSVGLEQVQQIVAQAAASVLGTDAEGETPAQVTTRQARDLPHKWHIWILAHARRRKSQLVRP